MTRRFLIALSFLLLARCASQAQRDAGAFMTSLYGRQVTCYKIITVGDTTTYYGRMK